MGNENIAKEFFLLTERKGVYHASTNSTEFVEAPIDRYIFEQRQNSNDMFVKIFKDRLRELTYVERKKIARRYSDTEFALIQYGSRNGYILTENNDIYCFSLTLVQIAV